ncbi:MAG TPA: hypothetical protein PLC99_14155 [Verrucomicrobiota bacterium]|nr:hypothetical protein [Verrucomicrobiota bacterium]
MNGGCGASFCTAECDGFTCEIAFYAEVVDGICYCFPREPGNLDGEACNYDDQVNVETGFCAEWLICVGMHPDHYEYPCVNDLDCSEYYSASFHPECIEGFCAFSFCSMSCLDGICAPGFETLTIGDGCTCIPIAPDDEKPGHPGDPCPFELVNRNTWPCVQGLVCIGNAGGPEYCSGEADCQGFGYEEAYNFHCTEQSRCGFSFCAAECTDGQCDSGFVPVEIDDTCYCVPETAEVTGWPGDPCPYGQVNANAAECTVGLACLGVSPSPSEFPCPSGDGDCQTYLEASWNPDCVDGGCGASFCALRCIAGACETGSEPIAVEGICYCTPN